MSKKVIKLISVAMSLLLLGGCSNNEGGDGKDNNSSGKHMVTVSGSTSVGPLMEVLADSYKEKNSNVDIEIQQIGSSAGIKNAISGVSELGISSRDLKEDELSSVASVAIAYDGIVLIVNNDNIVRDLTIEEIRKIYTGEIKNWNEVGGNDQPVIVVSREDGSGTRDAFQEIVGFDAEELVQSAIIGDGNGSIKTTVIGNKNAVGYISFEYLDASIVGLSCNGVEPQADNVLNKTYKLARPFLVVYRETSISNDADSFIKYILSDEGQNIVEENGNIRVQ